MQLGNHLDLRSRRYICERVFLGGQRSGRSLRRRDRRFDCDVQGQVECGFGFIMFLREVLPEHLFLRIGQIALLNKRSY